MVVWPTPKRTTLTLRRVSFSSVFRLIGRTVGDAAQRQRQRAELLRQRQRFRLTRQKLKRRGLANDDLLAVFLFDSLIDRENANVAENRFAAVLR